MEIVRNVENFSDFEMDSPREKKIGGTKKQKGTDFTSAENTRKQSERVHAWLPPISVANCEQ